MAHENKNIFGSSSTKHGSHEPKNFRFKKSWNMVQGTAEWI